MTVPMRHSPWVFLVAATALQAATPGVTLTVANETGPPGGFAQFKIGVSSPALISAAGLSLIFDPAIFGSPVSVAAFSATGDQTGYASLQGQQVTGSFTSASASIGQLPALPIFVVTVPILSTAAVGATSSIAVDTTAFPWQDQLGNTYSVSATPGSFTVGGTLSVQSVTPGGGLLPSGTVVSLAGTGFDASTKVTIDGVSIASTQFVSSTQVNVTLGGATEMNGKHLHVSSASGAVDVFSAIPAPVPNPLQGFALLLPSLPFVPYTAVTWDYPISTGMVAYYSCLQNPNAFPVDVTYYFASSGGQKVTTFPVVIPPYGLYTAQNSKFANTLGAIYMTVSAPIRMAEFRSQQGSPGAPGTTTTVYPPTQMTGLGLLGENGFYLLSWTWQIGTPMPKAQSPSITGPWPFTVSVSGGAEAWLTVTPTQGTPPATLTVTPNFSQLGQGHYQGTVTVTPALPPDLAQFGSGAHSTSVTVDVSSQPTITYSGGSVFFRVTNPGTPPPPSTITVTTNGTQTPFTATIVPGTGGNWLSINPSSGTTPGTITLTANPAGLGPGLYTSDVKIVGPINTLDISSAALFIPDTTVPPLTVTPASETFVREAGSNQRYPTNLLAVTPTVPYNITVSDPWIQASTFATSLELDVNPVGLAPGTYHGTVTLTPIADPSAHPIPAQVAITLIALAAPSQVTIAPSSLTLSTTVGSSATGTFIVSTPGGAPGVFSLGFSEVGGLTWQPSFQITSTGPTAQNQLVAPATIQLSASATAAGIYRGTIQLTWTGGASALVPITLTVGPSPSTPPVISAIVASGSESPGSISPGELITIFGSALTSPVSINGVNAPAIYASPNQINAIVPFDAAGANVVVRVAQGMPWAVPLVQSAPSLFTLSGAGTGPGAIVNQDGSINSAANPASRGTAIQIYGTGGGQTSPLSTTGAIAFGPATLVLPVKVTIAGVDAQVLYAGNAPGEIEGVVQINVVVPSTAAPGILPVTVTIGAATSAPVTLAIR